MNSNRTSKITSERDFVVGEEYKIIGLHKSPWGSNDDVELDTKILHLDITAWKVADGPIVHNELWFLRRGITEDELDSLMNSLESEQVRTFTVTLERILEWKDRRTHACVFKLDSYEDALAHDEELAAIKKENDNPAYYSDSRFGMLNFSRLQGRWESKDERDSMETDEPFEFYFYTGTSDESELVALLKLAEEFWKFRLSWKEKVEDRIVTLFLDQKNSGLEQDKTPFTQKRFIRNLDFHSIGFRLAENHLSYRLEIRDSGMFGHRDFVVKGTAKGSSLDIQLVDNEYSEGEWESSSRTVGFDTSELVEVKKKDSIWTDKFSGVGATDAQLDAVETKLGIKIPESLRNQLRIRNGGNVADSEEFYIPSGGISEIRYWKKGSDYFSEYEDVEEGSGFPHLGIENLDDLIVFAHHVEEAFCLDYRHCGRNGMPAVSFMFLDSEIETQFENVDQWIEFLISLRS